MFYRIAILSLALFFLAAANLNAGGDFPKTAEDYASLYEMQLYKQFRGNSTEYRRRIDVSKKVLRDFKKAGRNANEQLVIDWFRTASHSGVAPAAPAFAANSNPQRSPQSQPAQPQQSAATPFEKPVKPEYDWGQTQDPAEASTPETAPEPDFEEMANELGTDSADQWSAEDLDDAFDDPAETSSSSENLVTSDPAAASVIKKSNQLPTTQPANTAGDEDSEAMPDLSGVWGDSSSNESETMESPDMLAAADGLEESATAVAEATGFGDSTGLGDWTSNLPTAPGGNMAVPAMGVAPMALMGVGVINGIISLICMFKQLIAAFKNSALLGIVSLVFCGIGGLIIGWVKHKEWGLTKTMKVWTACTVIGILLQVGAGVMAATMGG